MKYLLDSLLKIYCYIIIVRVIIFWVYPNPYNPLVRLIHGLTDPVLEPTLPLIIWILTWIIRILTWIIRILNLI